MTALPLDDVESLRRQCFSMLKIERDADLAAVRKIAAMLEDSEYSSPDLKRFTGGKFSVYGPSGEGFFHPDDDITVVADSAITKFMNLFGIPDIIVTDLDGGIDNILFCQKKGSLLFVHVHGDNIPTVLDFLETFSGNAIFTSQAGTVGCVHDFGGFTDGDRAAYIADSLSAERITLRGFNFERPVPKPGSPPARKLLKIGCAREFIRILAEKRGRRLESGDVISF
ncbi:MAG: DUF115 domain-containing protein [Candidatus Thermoplasmatota archaeon]|nr:DUF115 domain-containing protein [Candidatus Thermoplasmatota archaeon]